MTKISDDAVGHWAEILPALGIPADSLARPNVKCPLHSPSKDSFSYNPQLETFYCRSCQGGSAMELLKRFHGWTYSEAAREVEKVLGNVQPKPFKPVKDPSEYLNRIYSKSRPATLNGPVHCYLRARGLSLLPDVREIPALNVKGQTYAAMVGLVVNIKKEAQSLHLTYLDGDKKAALEVSKRLLPPKNGPGSLKGCAIRLWTTASDTLHLAEGVETASSIRHMTTDGDIWAACNAVLLEYVQVPEAYKNVQIWPDRDGSKSYAGEKAAYTLAARLTRENKHVEVWLPDKSGMDWLDIYNDSLKDWRVA